MVTVTEKGFDIVVRVAGVLPNSALVATVLGEHRVGVYAAPAYLEPRSVPDRLGHLCEHEYIGFASPGLSDVLVRSFEVGGSTVCLVPRSRLSLNSNNAILATAKAGHGMMTPPRYVTRANVAAERLVDVLPSLDASTGRIYALRPESRLPSHKVRQFVEFLKQTVGDRLRTTSGTDARGIDGSASC